MLKNGGGKLVLGVKSLRGTASPQTIGGIAVGTDGSTGIYPGYRMVGGDDFDDTLNIVTKTAPLNKYFATRGYAAGARSFIGTILAKGYDADPYDTGFQDSNRGVAVGFNNMTQSASKINLKARLANGGETAHINTAPLLTSMIHTGGYMTASPPCIIEFTVEFSVAPPAGWHPTCWVLSAAPPGANVTPSLEFDFPECSSQHGTANVNVGGSPTGWTTNSTSLSALSIIGGGQHLYSLVITASSVLYYFDGTLVKTEAHDGTICGRPFYWLFTCHSWNGTFDSIAYDQAAWNSSGATGGTMSVDSYRVWLPNATAPVVLTPPALPIVNVACDAALTYTYPSLATLWGGGFAGSDYCAACKHEDYDPGTTAQANFARFPATFSFNTGTRVLTGTASEPGRMHTTSTPYLSTSCLGYVARGYVNVGPKVTTVTQNLTNGVPYTRDVYTECNVGSLLPKTITVGTLPAGLTFDGVSTISGTPTVNATTAVPITVVNSVGQSVTTNVSYVVTAAVALVLDGTPVTATNSATLTVAASITTTKTNTMLVVIVNIASGGSATVASTSGLTWTQRTSTGVMGGTTDHLEFTAPCPSIVTGEVVTVTFGSSTTSRMFLFGIAGVGNTAAPFDTDVSIPAATVDNASHTTISRTISTAYANDMTIAFLHTVSDHSTAFAPPAGWTLLISPNGFYHIYYKIQTVTLSSQAVTFSWTGGMASAIIVDAFKGN